MAKRTSPKKQTSKPKNVVAEARGGKAPSPTGGAGFVAWLIAAWQVVWRNVKSLAGAVAIYLVVKTLFIEAFRIPSGSMIPTLLIGDWLFVNKLVYGPSIPFTDLHLPGYSHPKHQDVVVFVSPTQFDNGADSTPTLVKRLIGMPGDTLYMREGVLYLNGLAQRQGYAASKYQGTAPESKPDETYPPTLKTESQGLGPAKLDTVYPGFNWQRKYEVANSRFGPAPAILQHDNWGPILVPPDHYFMMGDNRYCSKDGRYWGFVPKANIRGQPLFVYYSYIPSGDASPCDGDVSDKPLPFITDIRWRRLFHPIR
jgi:signal peptidase I